MFYFDEDTVIIYPADKAGFDKIYARVHITNINGVDRLFQSYTIKSLKEKSAIVISPKSIDKMISNLKTLVDSNYDASFKLTQVTDENNAKRQYLEVVGSVADGTLQAIFRNMIEISTVF